MNSLHRKLYLTLLCCAPLVLAACGSSGSGGTKTTNDTPPLAPSGVNASAGDGVIDISWNSVTGATGYNLYWGTSSGVTKQNGTRMAGVSSPYSLAGLTNGSPYYFIVSAENTMGEGAASAEASATPQISPPQQVTGLNVTPLVQGVQLSWNAVNGADSFNLYWSTSTGVTPQTGTRIAGVTSPHTLSSLTAGMAHYFVVTAANAGGEGQASAEVSATPSAPVAGWSAQE
ncbi:MAG: fibronectin type III domain-containing protein, partial [Gammaproteobacteria bacterium]|nr:fibronectin type III domain-containing protein [Gammaproteobacteria bacterium]